MIAYSIYLIDTGLFTGDVICCAPKHLAANVPPGCSCLPGRYDSLSQRVDHASGQILDYRPPQPSSRHDWDEKKRRWIYQPTPLEICHDNRRMGYPPLADLADALYWQARGNAEPMQRYLAAVDTVKQAHPKPEA